MKKTKSTVILASVLGLAGVAVAQTGGPAANVNRGNGFGCQPPSVWVLENGGAICKDLTAPPPPPVVPPPAPVIPPNPPGLTPQLMTVMYGPLLNSWAGPWSSPTPSAVFFNAVNCLGTYNNGSITACDASTATAFQAWLGADAAAISALQTKYYNLYLSNFPVLSSTTQSFSYTETFTSATGKIVDVAVGMTPVICGWSCLPSNLNMTLNYK